MERSGLLLFTHHWITSISLPFFSSANSHLSFAESKSIEVVVITLILECC